ncbi:Flagellar motility protein MotE, a chaperone for MotC folding [Amphibacillus marinus]|uniref:Flagellar motility protein MotE, a chaperone for MotC folding n=1 Tax=Amphibacillus marinus TaxID=872970 RepID=A0A1H8HT68_9BACI|nr:hypothetical protein [Amphibacillus marinus]SEN58888.1 Flagellar motility protein MotE, a chaperone for MotC folding [Amphibacillus marinus]
MSQIKETPKQKNNNIRNLTLVILALLIVMMAVLVFIMPMFGFEPLERPIGYVKSLFGSSQEAAGDATANFEQTEQRYLSQIEQYENQLNEAEVELAQSSAEIDRLTQDIVRLNNQIDNLRDEAEEGSDVQESVLSLAKTYTEMSAVNAAAILANVSDSLAISILREIKESERGAILSAMDPELAARYTEQLAN